MLRTPPLHRKFATMNGESSVVVLREALKLHHDPHPWDDLWRAMAVEHPLHDEWWDERDLVPLLDRVEVPDLSGVRLAERAPAPAVDVPRVPGARQRARGRVAMLGEFGLTWPWESLHVEALAWYDHWLKDRDTGILDGEPIRYWMPGADEWRTEHGVATSGCTAARLRAPGRRRARRRRGPRRRTLADDARDGSATGRSRARPIRPSMLEWTTAPLEHALDVAGDLELELHATATAIDTAWFVTLQDVAPDGTTVDVTAGYLRASLRTVDDERSVPGAPVLACRASDAVVPGELTVYRVPLVANARRFDVGHRLRVVLASDDQDTSVPAIMGFRHASVGTSSLNTIHSASRLLVPVT